MTWWLSVFFFVNGAWVPGSDVDGWAPRAYDSEAHCLDHKSFAEKECLLHPLDYEAVWVCSKDKPAEKPAFKEPPVDC
jgi:hypothetical protein